MARRLQRGYRSVSSKLNLARGAVRKGSDRCRRNPPDENQISADNDFHQDILHSVKRPLDSLMSEILIDRQSRYQPGNA